MDGKNPFRPGKRTTPCNDFAFHMEEPVVERPFLAWLHRIEARRCSHRGLRRLVKTSVAV
jgi:hypothetical protein